MNETLKAIVRILEQGTPELQVAAAQILGELEPKEPAVTRALAGLLSGSETVLTRFVLEALAGIESKAAVAALVDRLAQGGPLAERLAFLLSRMGSQATRALGELLEEGEREVQTRILEILGGHEDLEALTVLRKAVLKAEPVLAEKAADVLLPRADRLTPRQRQVLWEALKKSLSGKAAAKLRPENLVQGIRVLAALDGAACRSTLLKFTASRYPPIVRQAGLRGLEPVPLTPGQRDTILGLLVEEDMTHVVRPAMQLLGGVRKWGAGAIVRLKKLIANEREELRLFALRALRSCHTAEMARIGLQHLLKGGTEFQAAAAEALSENPAALEPLLKAFSSERNPDRARLLAGPLGQLRGHFKAETIKTLADKCGKLLASREPLGEVHLELLLRIDPEQGTHETVEKALRLRRARKLPESLTILLRLARTGFLDSEGQYQLAVARLLSDAKLGEAGAPGSGDAAMGYFTPLVRSEFPLLGRLQKEGQLTPAQLVRIGSHFAKGVAKDRRFGTQLLEFVVQRHGRRQEGEEARLMLRGAQA